MYQKNCVVGNCIVECWYESNGRKDVYHNPDGPAVLWPNGSYEWLSYGIHHRIGGPAVAWFNNQGQMEHQEWWYNGELHREDGPAVVGQDRFEYWIDGKQMTKMEFFIRQGDINDSV